MITTTQVIYTFTILFIFGGIASFDYSIKSFGKGYIILGTMLLMVNTFVRWFI